MTTITTTDQLAMAEAEIAYCAKRSNRVPAAEYKAAVAELFAARAAAGAA